MPPNLLYSMGVELYRHTRKEIASLFAVVRFILTSVFFDSTLSKRTQGQLIYAIYSLSGFVVNSSDDKISGLQNSVRGFLVKDLSKGPSYRPA